MRVIYVFLSAVAAIDCYMCNGLGSDPTGGCFEPDTSFPIGMCIGLHKCAYVYTVNTKLKTEHTIQRWCTTSDAEEADVPNGCVDLEDGTETRCGKVCLEDKCNIGISGAKTPSIMVIPSALLFIFVLGY